MALIMSGKDGTLYREGVEVVPVNNWKLSLDVSLHAYAANDTNATKRRVAGVEDSTGSFTVGVESDAGACCPVTRGEHVTLQLHIDDTGNNYYEVPVVIGSFELDCDINDGGPLIWTVNFEGDGVVVAHGSLNFCTTWSSSSGEV